MGSAEEPLPQKLQRVCRSQSQSTATPTSAMETCCSGMTGRSRRLSRESSWYVTSAPGRANKPRAQSGNALHALNWDTRWAIALASIGQGHAAVYIPAHRRSQGDGVRHEYAPLLRKSETTSSPAGNLSYLAPHKSQRLSVARKDRCTPPRELCWYRVGAGTHITDIRRRDPLCPTQERDNIRRQHRFRA